MHARRGGFRMRLAAISRRRTVTFVTFVPVALMIAKLRGLLDGFGADFAVIDVAGVGYLVSASSRTLSALGAIGEEVVLHTEMLVAEDSIRLVGFTTATERDWFRLLTSVQGVGARVALGILSALSVDEVHRAVASGDNAMIARAQGVGPKLAQRIVNELKDKAGAIALGAGGAAAPVGGNAQDAISALANLGFRLSEAAAAVAKAEAEVGADATLDLLVRTALKKAAR
jgi:holliday junction DNA helicase RuvA